MANSQRGSGLNTLVEDSSRNPAATTARQRPAVSRKAATASAVISAADRSTSPRHRLWSSTVASTPASASARPRLTALAGASGSSRTVTRCGRGRSGSTASRRSRPTS